MAWTRTSVFYLCPRGLYTKYENKELKKIKGARSGAIGCGTELQSGKPRFRYPMGPLGFFIDIILPVALWTWARLKL